MLERALQTCTHTPGTPEINFTETVVPTSPVLTYMRAKSLQSCPTLCDPINYSPPGFSVHGILQAGILEWVAMPSSIGIYGERETKEGRFCSQETHNLGKEISKEIISLHCGNPSKEIRRIEGSRPYAIRFCCCLVAKSWLLCDPMDCSP